MNLDKLQANWQHNMYESLSKHKDNIQHSQQLLAYSTCSSGHEQTLSIHSKSPVHVPEHGSPGSVPSETFIWWSIKVLFQDIVQGQLW